MEEWPGCRAWGHAELGGMLVLGIRRAWSHSESGNTLGPGTRRVWGAWGHPEPGTVRDCGCVEKRGAGVVVQSGKMNMDPLSFGNVPTGFAGQGLVDMDMVASQGLAADGKISHVDLLVRHRRRGGLGRDRDVAFSSHGDSLEVDRGWNRADVCQEDAKLSSSWAWLVR